MATTTTPEFTIPADGTIVEWDHPGGVTRRGVVLETVETPWLATRVRESNGYIGNLHPVFLRAVGSDPR